ncbi:glutamine amidotransferase [Janthinobacterium sp. Marseille]|nr:imidazole glycerol phosphate synthase subunit HisH [Janthinobacterium sp. Marseille]ABR91600.1 glutamine amidotransferase [Janthinobacterium sp. Marseille]
MDKRVAIVDLGLGNIGAVANMLLRAGGVPCLTSNPAELQQYSKVMLPGVGSFDTAVTKLDNAGFRDALRQYVDGGGYLLGICLGMQLLADSSEEGVKPGLGFIPGIVKRFSFDAGSNLKIPHMGWNQIECAKAHPLVSELDQLSRFYFVHSYHFSCLDKNDELLRTQYGYEFSSGVQRNNVMGVQFHPEKSHRYGMQLIKNFVEI